MLRMTIRRLLGAARLTTMRMQQPIPSASKLASGLAADPQHSALTARGGNAELSRIELLPLASPGENKEFEAIPLRGTAQLRSRTRK